MHWFWRAAISIAAGILAIGILFLTILLLVLSGGPIAMPVVVVIQIFVVVGPSSIAVAVYGTLTRRYYRDRLHVGETQCRKCGYILRGIPEPRCSECGERI